MVLGTIPIKLTKRLENCQECCDHIFWISLKSSSQKVFCWNKNWINMYVYISISQWYRNNIRLLYINIKKIAFGNKEHTTDQKMGVSVLLRLFISSNEVCNTAYALSWGMRGMSGTRRRMGLWGSLIRVEIIKRIYEGTGKCHTSRKHAYIILTPLTPTFI